MMNRPTLMDSVVDLILNTPSADVTPTAIEAVKRLTLDSLGVAIAGHDQPGIYESRRLIEGWGGSPEATLWLSKRKVPLPNAAFLNSALVHALDFDDKHYAAGMHVMSTALPVACAVAEDTGSSGRDLLTAIAVGVEISTRVGEALMDARMNLGFLPASLVGGFGATAVIARLLGLSHAETRNALGLWYCQASGNRQALLDRSLGKRLQPAFAARSAIWAAELARLGVTGPEGAFDGQVGLFNLYTRSEPPSYESLMAPMDAWAVESYWIKLYPSCGGCHRPTAAAIQLAEEHDVDHREIESVVVQVGESSGWHLGSPFKIGADPQVDAQFSIAYSVALGLTRRHAFLDDYETDQILSDVEVLDISKLVKVEILPDTTGLRSDQVEVILHVTMRNGTVFEKRVRELLGSPDNPMSFEQVEHKFRNCCDYGKVAKGEADAIVASVLDLEHAESVHGLLADLANAGAGP